MYFDRLPTEEKILYLQASLESVQQEVERLRELIQVVVQTVQSPKAE